MVVCSASCCSPDQPANMLPELLHGPGLVLGRSPDVTFLKAATARYPELDRDFILQICYEHPARFDRYLPGFDPDIHVARRGTRNTQWIRRNIRYDRNEELDFHWSHFNEHLAGRRSGYWVFDSMIREETWPFPPVVISESFALELGAAPQIVGGPYWLIEGTHRVSYLLRMYDIGRVSGSAEHPIIFLLPGEAASSRPSQ